MDLPFKQYGWALKNGWSGDDTPANTVSYVGHMQSLGGFAYEQVSNCFALHCILRGNGVFKIEGNEYEAGEGGIVLFSPGAHVLYWDEQSTPWEYLWFILEGENVGQILEMSGLSDKSPSLSLSDCSFIKRLFERISVKLENDDYSLLYSARLFWDILDTICENANPLKASTSIAKEAFLLMSNDLYFNNNINEIASRLGVDRTTLFRAFIREYGMPPLKMQTDLRMEHACSLLTNSRMGIAEISVACGYSSAPYFSNCFHERFGISPSKWREKKRNAED